MFEEREDGRGKMEGGKVSRVNSVRGEGRWKREDGRREGK